jgi:hypothetical protein
VSIDSVSISYYHAREWHVERERLQEEVDDVANDEELDRTHLRFSPARKKLTGEEARPCQERSECRQDPAVDVRDAFEHFLGQMRHRVVVAAGGLAAIRAGAARHVCAARLANGSRDQGGEDYRSSSSWGALRPPKTNR